METLKSILQFLKDKPIWVRILGLIAILIACVIMLASCGVTRAKVVNSANGTTTTISITTNNPTSVDASPEVQLNIKPE